MSKENKKQKIIESVNEFVKNGVIDMTKFRNDYPSIYATLPYYFGGVNKMLDELGLVKIQRSPQKNKMTLRNRLAYDMLVELRKTNTLEQIAARYDVSRALVNQLHKALESSIDTNETDKQKEKL